MSENTPSPITRADTKPNLKAAKNVAPKAVKAVAPKSSSGFGQTGKSALPPGAAIPSPITGSERYESELKGMELGKRAKVSALKNANIPTPVKEQLEEVAPTETEVETPVVSEAKNKEADKIADKLSETPGVDAENNEDGTITITVGDSKQTFNLKDKTQRDELIKLAQKGKSAHQVWNDADKIKKEANNTLAAMNAIAEALKTRTKEVLRLPALGIDAVGVANEILMEHYNDLKDAELDSKDDGHRVEYKKMMKAQQEKENLDKQQQASKSQADKAAQEKAINDEYQTKTLETLKEHNLVSKDENTNLMITNQIFYYINQAAQGGVKLEPKDVIDQVKHDYVEYVNRFMLNMPEDQLENILPKEFMDKVRKLNMSKLASPEVRKAPAAKKSTLKPAQKDKRVYMNGPLNEVVREGNLANAQNVANTNAGAQTAANQYNAAQNQTQEQDINQVNNENVTAANNTAKTQDVQGAAQTQAGNQAAAATTGALKAIGGSGNLFTGVSNLFSS